MSDVNPSDAVDAMDSQPEDAAAASSDSPDSPAEDSGSSSVSISEMLLSTEPDETPSQHPDKSEPVAHGLIAMKKMLSAAGSSVDAGTPAIVNLGLSAFGFLAGSDTAEPDDSADTEPDRDVA
jgi:hypothetical protein